MNKSNSSIKYKEYRPETWDEMYKTIKNIVSEEEDEPLFFRGQSETKWRLEPGISRNDLYKDNTFESNLFFTFKTRAGNLLTNGDSPWGTIFTMQHHGLPTRFLDWTELFSVALYFAIVSAHKEAALWILNPYKLNKRTINLSELIHPTELNFEYEAYYIARTNNLEGNVIALSPLRHIPRVFNQRAGFTLHDDLANPLEDLHPDVLHKIIIGEDIIPDAKEFLQLAGITEFSLFPDLDGLSRDLNNELL